MKTLLKEIIVITAVVVIFAGCTPSGEDVENSYRTAGYLDAAARACKFRSQINPIQKALQLYEDKYVKGNYHADQIQGFQKIEINSSVAWMGDLMLTDAGTAKMREICTKDFANSTVEQFKICIYKNDAEYCF